MNDTPCSTPEINKKRECCRKSVTDNWRCYTIVENDNIIILLKRPLVIVLNLIKSPRLQFTKNLLFPRRGCRHLLKKGIHEFSQFLKII